MASIGDRQLQLAEDYAAALDGLADRQTGNIQKALWRAMRASLNDLRRFYVDFLDENIPSDQNFKGGERRPYEYSIRQVAHKFNAMRKLAKTFMPEPQLRALEETYAQDLREALVLGSELNGKLLAVLEGKPEDRVAPTAASPDAIAQAVLRTSAYIRGEVASFRDELAQLVTGAIARGKSFRSLEADVRQALRGARDPQGLTKRMGLNQRAELIARSELANAYAEGQLSRALQQGLGHVRWIATHDERTCPTCASRHGLIYAVGAVVAPGHPRCRCSLSPVPNEAMQESDPKVQDQLLDGAYWRDSRATMVKEFAAGKGWDVDRARAALEKAVQTPSASERRRYPTAEKALKPALGWPSG